MDTIPWREGKVQGAVYDFDEEIIKISAKAYEMFMWSNPLHADVFKAWHWQMVTIEDILLISRDPIYFYCLTQMHIIWRRLDLYCPLAKSHKINVHLLTFIFPICQSPKKGIRKMEAECIAMVLEWVYFSTITSILTQGYHYGYLND